MSAVTPPFPAFTAADSDRAYAEWGCNCGPAALAACLDLGLESVRQHLGDFERRRYMNPTMMGNAITALRARRRAMPHDPRPEARFPARGVVRIQFGGPWLAPGVPVGAAYARTHWVASLDHEGQPWVYDVNAGWLHRPLWESMVVPDLLAGIRRADGTWYPTHRWEVSPA
jgi:hypothetical protein